MKPEAKVLLVSCGLMIVGHLMKTKDKHVGNVITGMGIGSVLGTVGHASKIGKIETIPHHDLFAFASLPIIYTVDKMNVFNEDVMEHLYGISFGAFGQHLLTEGCSFCRTSFCEINENVC